MRHLSRPRRPHAPRVARANPAHGMVLALPPQSGEVRRPAREGLPDGIDGYLHALEDAGEQALVLVDEGGEEVLAVDLDVAVRYRSGLRYLECLLRFLR